MRLGQQRLVRGLRGVGERAAMAVTRHRERQCHVFFQMDGQVPCAVVLQVPRTFR